MKLLKTRNARFAAILVILLAFELIYILNDKFGRHKNHLANPVPYEAAYSRIMAEKNRERNKPAWIPPPKYLMEKYLEAYDLVNLVWVNEKIKVDLRYSTENNFLRTDMYGELDRAYLPQEVADAVSKAQNILNEKYPYYSIVVFDGTRPLYIQKMMWDKLQGPDSVKALYVANPVETSLHNYGAAVDVGLMNEDGWLVDMGTEYDFFGELGHPAKEAQMLADGKLTHRQVLNRKLLRDVMTDAGFSPYDKEWWHFNYCSKATAMEKFKLVN